MTLDDTDKLIYDNNTFVFFSFQLKTTCIPATMNSFVLAAQYINIQKASCNLITFIILQYYCVRSFFSVYAYYIYCILCFVCIYWSRTRHGLPSTGIYLSFRDISKTGFPFFSNIVSRVSVSFCPKTKDLPTRNMSKRFFHCPLKITSRQGSLFPKFVIRVSKNL